ncbi:MAG: ABC transporter ATP-binding protein [Thermoguttaceae bacterium]|jgi:peptide/nickel transport system ATP-binding protein|nr:ABC transporter ATP-binding protein [Thermoguttaceae bacterium]
MSDNLVTIDRLKTYFYTDDGVVKAVDDVSLAIPRGGTLGLVGESGCGKSVTALSIIRLVGPPGRIAGGSVTLRSNGAPTELTALSEDGMRKVRGRDISMIFQEPMTSLNPVFTVGSQISEAVELHQKVGRAEAQRRAVDMLRKVRIPEPEQRAKEYPHQFSGGMRQRAMIAMALSCNPKLLIADEPTTALDVTIQAQILDLLRDLQSELGMSILMITHDLGIIAEMADQVAVMYASKVVEYAAVGELFSRPRHPYTVALFRSRPKIGQTRSERLLTIEGMVPSPLRFPAGCKFHPRCPLRKTLGAADQQRCAEEEPELLEIGPGHQARCHFVEKMEDQ